MKPLLVVLAGALLSGCSGGGPDRPAPPPTTRTDVCVEVNAGISAFNAGQLQETVDRFRAAVPLAVEADRVASTTESDELLEAVIYYAELAPAAYPAASVTSPEFARYKAVTLGQCMPDPGTGDEDTVEA